MKFKNREEIKQILDMNITDAEKRNLIANLKNYKTEVTRIIVTDYELNIKEGQIWDNQGKATSWMDANAENTRQFIPETDRSIMYVLIVDGEVEGYQVQYFSYDKLFEYFYYDLDMEEDQADELAYQLANDEVYLKLMELLGSDGDMENEAEILIPAETQFRIKEINDGREDVGYIEVILEQI
jgi:hypothetical protein